MCQMIKLMPSISQESWWNGPFYWTIPYLTRRKWPLTWPLIMVPKALKSSTFLPSMAFSSFRRTSLFIALARKCDSGFYALIGPLAPLMRKWFSKFRYSFHCSVRVSLLATESFFVQNHQTIKVEEVSLQTKPPMHIAEHSFSFPLIAKPGTWKADVHYGPNVSCSLS